MKLSSSYRLLLLLSLYLCLSLQLLPANAAVSQSNYANDYKIITSVTELLIDGPQADDQLLCVLILSTSGKAGEPEFLPGPGYYQLPKLVVMLAEPQKQLLLREVALKIDGDHSPQITLTVPPELNGLRYFFTDRSHIASLRTATTISIRLTTATNQQYRLTLPTETIAEWQQILTAHNKQPATCDSWYQVQ